MTRSYWQIINRSPKHKVVSPLEISGSYDIAIVGGGLMGIAIAYYLNSMGCDRVVVLEKKFIGYGASGRNAGFLLSGMAEPYSRLVVGMGRTGAKMLMQATIDNHALIESAIVSEKFECDYRSEGSYHLAVSNVESKELSESVELLIRDGFNGEYFNSISIAARLGFGRYFGGYYCPVDGSVDPFAFVTGLAHNVNIAENFEVKNIIKSGGQVEIASDDKSVRAEMAILATNAYSPLLDSFFKELIFPVRGQMLAAKSDQSYRLGKTGCYANFGYDYFRRSSEGTVLIGGLRDKYIESEIGYDDDVNPALQNGLEEYLKFNLGLTQPEIICRWSGLMANTIDGLPLVGALPHNSSVVAAVGCNGHGFGLGMVIARDIATALMKNETSELLNRLSLKRFIR